MFLFDDWPFPHVYFAKNGFEYICGCSDARHMAHDVDAVLHKIVSNHGVIDAASTQDYLKRLRSRGRYCCDVWS